MTDLNSLLSELTSGGDSRAEAAVSLIAEIGRESIPSLTDLLGADHVDHRWWAIRVFSEIRCEEIGEYLHVGLKDPDVAVKQCAALALREQPFKEAAQDLALLLGHDNRLLSRLAGDAMVALGENATQLLLEVAKDESHRGRLEAVRALAEIGDYASITTLFSLLDGDSALMEYWAAQGLEKMGVGMMFFDPS